MSNLAWPLQRNQIRRDVPNHTFGMVRNGGTRPHQGWDLYAAPGTTVYAIADGTIRWADHKGLLGKLIVLEFVHGDVTLYAAYAHLQSMLVKQGATVSRGDAIGLAGLTGNASSMTGADQHLHFEIRTTAMPGLGLGDRIDPATLYGRTPLGCAVVETHNDKAATGCD